MSQNEPVMSQRARFEHWFSDQGEWPQAVERSGEGYKLMQAQSSWETWKAACPEGWQAVPIEPDGAMQVAGLKVRVEEDGTAAVYRAILAAAPKPEDV